MIYNSKKTGFMFILPFVIGLFLFTAFPFVASFALSFMEYDVVSTREFVGLENYKYMFADDDLFWKSLSVTLIYVLITVPIKLGFALFIAFILNFKIRGINIFRTIYYIPSILGGSIAIAVLWRALFSIDGVVNLLLGYVGIPEISWLGDPNMSLFTISLLRAWQFGSAMVIFLAALQTIPMDLYDAAVIDGAKRWSIFRNVTVPMITPVIFFNLIMQMAQAFQEFNGPYIITKGGPLHSTYLLSLYVYESAFKNFEMGYASALAWILFALIAILTGIAFASQKYWVNYADK